MSDAIDCLANSLCRMRLTVLAYYNVCLQCRVYIATIDCIANETDCISNVGGDCDFMTALLMSVATDMNCLCRVQLIALLSSVATECIAIMPGATNCIADIGCDGLRTADVGCD